MEQAALAPTERPTAPPQGGSLGRAPAPRGGGRLLRLLRTRLVKAMLAAHAVLLAVLLARDQGWLQPLELGAYDHLVVALSGHEVSDRVLVVAATEEDIDRYGWPLRDGDLAALLDRLLRLGAGVVGVDLYRDKPLPPGTQDLAEMQRNEAVFWVYKAPDAENLGVPAPQPVAESARAALADVVTDAGGIIRRGLLAAEDSRTGFIVRTLGTALAERYTGQRLRALGDGVALGAGRIVLLSDGRFGPYASVDAAGYQTLLDFRGGERYLRRLSVQEAMEGEAVASLAPGRIIIIGNAALSVRDNFATPLSVGRGGGVLLPGAVLHGHLADQLIRLATGEGTSRAPLPRVAEAAILWLAALAGMAIGLSCATALFAALALALAVGVLGWIVYLAFGAGLLLPGVPAALVLLAAAGGTIWTLHGLSLRERLRLRRSFEHYLDARIIEAMLADDRLASFGGEYREITVMFTDLTDSTTLTELLPAEQVAELLNDYFDGVCTAVVACGGLVNNFTGDGLMALFGAPQRQEDQADRAINAALAVDAFGCRFSAAQRQKGLDFGLTRIGVHTGVALVGNIGTRAKLQYGAVGDVLNTASRLEGLNKATGTRICVSGETARRCRRHRFLPLGEFVLKGRRAVLPVLTPLPASGRAEEEKARALRFETAYAALRAGRPEAAALFRKLHEEDPIEPCAAFHNGRLAEGERGVHLVMPQK